MAASNEHLTSLHTALIDASNGYEEAMHDAEGKGLTALFREMMALHTQDAAEIATHLITLGEKVDDKGSFMSTVHRAVISVRSLFGGLDESILPGLIDGEERLLSYYDEAINDPSIGSFERAILVEQRTVLREAIDDLKSRNKVAA
jgi:uncharacterized protein (TIGR02284 family)